MLKKRSNVVFLVLHYLSFEDTVDCVESIMKLDNFGNNVQIVIVDNGSSNSSGVELEKRFSSKKMIHIITLKTNLGFSRGNNVGFKYAKYKLNADFIIMINNDVEMIQDDFIKKILEKYEEKRYAVLGPKILLRGGKVNQIYYRLQSLDHYKKDLRILFLEYIMSITYLFPIYERVRRWSRETLIRLGIKKKVKQKNPDLYYENIVLHGCAVVFSKFYISKFDGIDAKTFLYREEELLYLRLMTNNMSNIYCPDILVYHDEDGATDAMLKSKRKKRLFVYKNMIKSTKTLINELERDSR